MIFEQDVHAVADGVADGGDLGEAGVEVGAGDARAARGVGGGVEGPDLHRGDAFLQQRLREGGGVVGLGGEVVGDGAGERGVAVADHAGAVDAGGGVVAGAGAGVVDRDAVADGAAEEVREG